MILKHANPRSTVIAKAEAAADAPKHDFHCRWIDSAEELEAIQSGWERLLDVAIHANLLFDPDFLIPAFKHLGDPSVRILVVEAPDKKNPAAAPVVCGLIPLQKKRIYGLPLSSLEIWQHDQCFDCTPLLRCDCAGEVLETVLDFLEINEKTSLLSLSFVSNEGEFSRVLTDVLRRRDGKPFLRESFTRACFQPEMDADTYKEQHVSKSIKKSVRRLNRRLEEQGEVSVITYHDNASSDELIEDFLRLEASGWKGEAGTALACDQQNQDFFKEMVTRSIQRGKLSFLTVNLDGQPISMLCDMYSRGVGYAYKTAFDDQMRDYSPGLMAELHNIDYMHELDLNLMDSCTDSENSTINRVWGGRIRFQSMVVPLHGKTSKWATALMPLMQHVRHWISPNRQK